MHELFRHYLQVETLKAERDVIESELKSTAVDMKSVFLASLARDGVIDEPNLTVEYIGTNYGPLQKQVRESAIKQEALISKIQVSNMNKFIHYTDKQNFYKLHLH